MRIDRTVLTEQAYADDSRLQRRISIYQYQRPPLDLPGFALAHLGEVSGPVLDVGWGAGNYTHRLRAERPDLRVIPLDLAPGMGPEIVADVMALPVRTGSAGAALAMHMLYYAESPRAAIAELRRVLRPGGRLLISTNAADDKRELAALWRESLHDLGVPDPPVYPAVDNRFAFEDAVPMVAAEFGTCETAEHHSTIVVPDVDPVVSYVDSSAAEHAPHLLAEISWDDYRRACRDRVRSIVEANGAYEISGHIGVIVATA